MGVYEKLAAAGFKPKANEDFPAFKGEYKIRVPKLELMKDKDSGEKTGYSLEIEIVQTLSGDIVDGRKLWKKYRVAGTNFDKSAITEEQATEALKALLNDLFTLGVQLDTTSEAALDASLDSARDATGYLRAWYWSPKNEPDRTIQDSVIRQEKDFKVKTGSSGTKF